MGEENTSERLTTVRPFGQKIYNTVFKQGWEMWVGHQTMFMNEYRLTPVDSKARKFLDEEMEKFFFEEGSKKT